MNRSFVLRTLTPLLISGFFSIPVAHAEDAPAAAEGAAAPAAAVTPDPNDPSTWPSWVTLNEASGKDLSPYGYVLTRKRNTGLIVTGAAVFGASYLMSTGIGAIASDVDPTSGAAFMFVPVVGPVIWAVTDGTSASGAYALALDSVAQTTGVVLFALGLNGTQGWERNSTKLLFTPRASADGVGLQASGTF